jgi:hypothetical protein
MRSMSKRLAALVGAPALALGAPALAAGALAGRPNGRGLPTIVQGGGLTAAGAAAIAAVIVAAVVVAAIGWRLDQRRVTERELAAEASATAGSRGPSGAGASPSPGRVGGELAGARARRVASREGEERR